ncbi:MAG: M23 family metallopeptidase [Anaerosomatales bacterium]|nr:M23 family metallopeptidase [Anaerosomatales bacterium]
MRGFSFRAAVALVLVALMAPVSGWAHEPLTKPAPGDVLLRFGQDYVAAGVRCTHRGLDIRGSEGDAVVAPCSGRVRFAGPVPADGGGRCVAVTVEASDGTLVTVMPLREVWVAAGTDVTSGDALGELAGRGDSSSETPHVHLSVRVAGRYVDPEPLLAATCDDGAATLAEPREKQPLEAAEDVQAVAAATGASQAKVRTGASAGRSEAAGVSGSLVDQRAGVPKPAAISLPSVRAGDLRDGVFRATQAMRRASAAVRCGPKAVAVSGTEQPVLASGGTTPQIPMPDLWASGALGALVLGAAGVTRRWAAMAQRTG